MNPGRAWAYSGVVLGASTSVAANVAHSCVRPEDAAVGWQPERGLILSAAFWPLALMIAVEVIVRFEWPDGFRFIAVRYAGVGTVATVAAVISYQHMSGLLRHYGETDTAVTIGPLAIDGLMLVSTAALLAVAPNRSGHGSVDTDVPVGADSVGSATPTAPDRLPPTDTPIDELADRPHPVEAVSRPQSVGATVLRSGPTPTPIDRGRSMDQLRRELTRAIRENRVDPTSAGSIRKTLGIGLPRARQLRDERAAKPPAADDEEESRSG